MKKILTLIFLSGLILTACGAKKTAGNVNDNSTTKTFESATSKLDVKQCATLEDKENRKNCEEIVTVEIMRNAVEKKSKSLCDKISDKSKKAECVQNVNNL